MTREERRLAMPITSEFWDAIIENFGTPERFSATENGHTIEYQQEEKRDR